MAERSLSLNVVTADEVLAREIECEMEWVELLLKHDPDAAERVAAAHEMITCGNEKGLEPWQSVMEFMRRNEAAAARILQDPIIRLLRQDYEDRFLILYNLQTGRRREIVDLFDGRIHKHTELVADGILRLKFIANQKRDAASHLSLQDAEAAVQSRVTTQVFEPRSAFDSTALRKVSGAVLTSYSPIVQEDGTISSDNREPLGTILSGRAFANLLNIKEEAA